MAGPDPCGNSGADYVLVDVGRDVILPITVIRRMDAVLEPSKPKALAEKRWLKEACIADQGGPLQQATGQAFYNASPFTLRNLADRQDKDVSTHLTCVWVLTSRKAEHRRGKVQLIDATQWHTPLRRNLGSKNCELSRQDIQRICDTFLAFEETEQSKIFPSQAFGYWKVAVERPLRVEGIDTERAYTAKEIKTLKDDGIRSESAPPVIRRINKPGGRT